MTDKIRVAAPVPPDLDGYLYKLKSKQSIFGNWTKRYFKINRMSATLEYFNSKPNSSDAAPLKFLDLTRLVNVRKYEGNCIQIEADGEGLMLRAASAAEQSCWISALQQYHKEWVAYKQNVLDESVRKMEEDQRVFDELKDNSINERK